MLENQDCVACEHTQPNNWSGFVEGLPHHLAVRPNQKTSWKNPAVPPSPAKISIVLIQGPRENVTMIFENFEEKSQGLAISGL